MDLHPGLRVNPNVCLVGQLGEGGMGSVWIADHTSLHTRVAVKFISAELVKTDASLVERFKREAALCAQIKSPHVVQTFDHGVMPDGRPYIVMELLEGESLQTRLARTGPMPIRETRSVVTQACKALSRAHRLGIVHRDIKPDNLFLSPDDDEPFLLKVLDFGIAKQTGLPQSSKMTSTGSMVGTPEYMSPEQVLSGASVDHRSDLWALAVVAYHCLTGQVPFRGETLGSLCVAIANARFEVPSRLRPDLLPSVDRWFERALALEPDHRFETAKEMAQAFAVALNPSATLEDFTLGDGTKASEEAPWSAGARRHVVRVEMPTSSGGPATSIGTSRTSLSSAGRNPSAGTEARVPALEAAPKTSTNVLLGLGGVSLAVAVAYFLLATPSQDRSRESSDALDVKPAAEPAPSASDGARAPASPAASAASPDSSGTSAIGTRDAATTPPASTTSPPPSPTTARPSPVSRPLPGGGANPGPHAVDRGF